MAVCHNGRSHRRSLTRSMQITILAGRLPFIPTQWLAMTPFPRQLCFLPLFALLSSLVLMGQSEADEKLNPKQVRFFETRIRPVLVKNCYNCHSTKTGKTKGGLALNTREGIRTGGDSGHGVVPGDIEASLIISAMKHESFEMPPKKQLPPGVIRDFESWIRMGAPDPRAGKSVVKNRSAIDFAGGREFWAFRKPVKPTAPKVQNSEWAQTEIDRFVIHRMEEAGLAPAPRAGAEQLLRRDSINLIGIPPTEKQIQAFLADTDPDRRIKWIDRLLQSKQFGERWGRHWLDVARFAESNGRERNFLFPHAWRYRNYVIDSFNNDKPFSRFVQEQIAGDLLEPLAGQKESEPRIGTGLLAVGPKQLNERNAEVFAMDMIDEQIDVICRSTMAMTVACARCHDHKFDPISTEDYYALAGIFRSTQTLFGKGGGGSRQSTALMNIGGNPEQDARLKKEHTARLARLTAEAKKIGEQIRGQNRKGKTGNGEGAKKASRPSGQELAKLRRRQKQLQQQLKQLRQNGPTSGQVAMGATEGKCVDCNVLIRGEVSARGSRVPRGFLTVLGQQERPAVADREASGRLELANWIVSPDNPLTARVTVNRIWRHLFGEGLVRTVDNFGETGEKPSHPELLDYLAIRLVENGWSFKKTIREIMLSETYQLSGDYRQANYEVDPDNRLLWRMNARRLDAEVLRDSILLAAGELDLTPPEASVVAKYKSTQGIGRGVTEETFDIHFPKRSVYLPVVRNAVPEPLRVFDFAEPSILVGDRQVTTVPTQALFMMNSEFVMQRARNLARELVQPGQEIEKQIATAYWKVLTRGPAQSEIKRARDYLESTRQKILNKDSKQNEAEILAMTAFCQALFASGEFRVLH